MPKYHKFLPIMKRFLLEDSNFSQTLLKEAWEEPDCNTSGDKLYLIEFIQYLCKIKGLPILEKCDIIERDFNSLWEFVNGKNK